MALLGLLAAKEIMAVGIADQAVQARAGTAAYWVRPGNSRASALAAGDLLKAGELDDAERLARRSLTHSAFDVVTIRTLGEIQDRRRRGSGDNLRVIAGRLGWRDRPTQLWLVERAIHAEQYEIAMTRSEAIVRQQRQPEIAYALFRLIAQTPRGRELVTRALVQRPFWRGDFLQKLDAESSEADVAVLQTLVRDLLNSPAPPNIVEARATIDALVTRGRPEPAYALHRQITGRGSDHRLLSNAAFEETGITYGGGGSGTFFDWRLYTIEESSADIDPLPQEGGNRILLIRSDGMNLYRLVDRWLVLPPGRYQLSYRVRAEEEAGLRSVRIALRCANRPGDLIPPPEGGGTVGTWQRRQHSFAVPAGCPMQVLEVLPVGQTGREAETMFDDFAVARIG